jgi:hypothetical protein
VGCAGPGAAMRAAALELLSELMALAISRESEREGSQWRML